MKTPKYSPKKQIMAIFKNFPNKALTSKEVYEAARLMGIFIPPAFNTHLSQLHAKGELEKVGRGTYRLNNEQKSVEVALKAIEAPIESKQTSLI